MNNFAVIKNGISKKFRHLMQRGRIMFFCAPCGFGKTTVAKALLKDKNVFFTDAGEANFDDVLKAEWEVLAVDDLQMLSASSFASL